MKVINILVIMQYCTITAKSRLIKTREYKNSAFFYTHYLDTIIFT